MYLFDFLVSELETATLFLSERGERVGWVFMAVFLQSLLTEQLELMVPSVRARWEIEQGGKLHSGAVISCLWLYVCSQWANARSGRLYEAWHKDFLLYFPPLLHTCTGIRQSPATVN